MGLLQASVPTTRPTAPSAQHAWHLHSSGRRSRAVLYLTHMGHGTTHPTRVDWTPHPIPIPIPVSNPFSCA